MAPKKTAAATDANAAASEAPPAEAPTVNGGEAATEPANAEPFKEPKKRGRRPGSKKALTETPATGERRSTRIATKATTSPETKKEASPKKPSARGRKRKAAEATDEAEKKEVKEGETAADGEPEAKKVWTALFICDEDDNLRAIQAKPASKASKPASKAASAKDATKPSSKPPSKASKPPSTKKPTSKKPASKAS
ncbi:hypothetical protein ACEPAI_8798 [Sanghuangporus weigelae]